MRRNMSARKASKGLIFKEPDILCKGWLRKQGGKFKTLKKRYFVLAFDTLYYYTNPTQSYLKGQVCLINLELSDVEEDKANNEYVFYIYPEIGKDIINEAHARYMLVTNDKKEAENWMFNLKQVVYLRRGGGLFGTSLNKVQPFLRSQYDYVPRVVFECCQKVKEIGMDEEGIFRKNGQLSEIQRIKRDADRAKYDWSGVDIHTICSLLKLYLRELPEPLIPFSSYDDLKAVGYRIEAKEGMEMVQGKLRLLPKPNQKLLMYLCEFLEEVSLHSENRMGVDSLAKLFSPNILRDADTDPYVEESTSSIISITVAALIKSHRELFTSELEFSDMLDYEFKSRDPDTYSLTSALSTIANMNINGSSLSLEQSQNDISDTVRRNYRIPSTDGLGVVSRARRYDITSCYSADVDLSDDRKTPISDRKFYMMNGKSDSFSVFGYCAHCSDIQRKLNEVTNNRDELLREVDVLNKTVRQLKDEVSRLQNEILSKQQFKLPYDLSDVPHLCNRNL